MTYQDPDNPRRPNDYIDRMGGGLGWAPIALGIVFVVVLGYLIFGSSWQAEQPTSGPRTEAPKTAPTPPAPAPTKPQ